MLKDTLLWLFGTIVAIELLALAIFSGSFFAFISFASLIVTEYGLLSVGGWILLLIGIILMVIAIYYGTLNRQTLSQILAIGSGIIIALLLYVGIFVGTIPL